VLAVLYSLLNMDIDTTGSSKPPVARQVNFLDANGLSKSLDDIRKDMREGYADGRKARMLHMIREFTAPYSDSAALGRFNTIVTHDDGHCLLLLPDGGRCWQNRNSFVSYPVNFFNDTPKLRIRGEAYVEVTQNKRARAPFEVRAGQIGVIAFNGSFNIRAYTDSLIIVTAIGSTLEIKLPASSVSLQSGEQLIIAGGRTELNKQADIGQVLEWERKEGR
jgi:hypothetical protein